jgi:PadR family transcriptional regulator, regulatory protein PadR
MTKKSQSSGLQGNLALELRRGVIILAVLCELDDEQYGYSLVKKLASKGLDIEQGTLYPLLRRLESNGLLQSDWRVEGSRPRRYYLISPDGKKILPDLKKEWDSLVEVMERITK